MSLSRAEIKSVPQDLDCRECYRRIVVYTKSDIRRWSQAINFHIRSGKITDEELRRNRFSIKLVEALPDPETASESDIDYTAAQIIYGKLGDFLRDRDASGVLIGAYAYRILELKYATESPVDERVVKSWKESPLFRRFGFRFEMIGS